MNFSTIKEDSSVNVLAPAPCSFTETVGLDPPDETQDKCAHITSEISSLAEHIRCFLV